MQSRRSCSGGGNGALMRAVLPCALPFPVLWGCPFAGVSVLTSSGCELFGGCRDGRRELCLRQTPEGHLNFIQIDSRFKSLYRGDPAILIGFPPDQWVSRVVFNINRWLAGSGLVDLVFPARVPSHSRGLLAKLNCPPSASAQAGAFLWVMGPLRTAWQTAMVPAMAAPRRF